MFLVTTMKLMSGKVEENLVQQLKFGNVNLMCNLLEVGLAFFGTQQQAAHHFFALKPSKICRDVTDLNEEVLQPLIDQDPFENLLCLQSGGDRR